jgi:sterol desaturase/sphingolipid hydroxylase (fatty acid hydroxylase superfamily)
MDDLIGGIIAFMVFLGLSIPIIVIALVYYLKKKLEHKQIMLAIEKGTPLSELKPVEPPQPADSLWIKNLTAGVAMLIIAAGLFCMPFLGYFGGPPRFVYFIVAVILFATGISHLIRGLLQRKAPPPTQSSDQTNN